MMIMLTIQLKQFYFRGVKKVNPKRKIISVFEPLIFQSYVFKYEFSKCFVKSNLVIMCPIYAAGESKI